MKYTILVVEDDDDDVFLLRNHIAECHVDITVVHAHYGPEAIQRLTDGLLPNLIIADNNMPLMNGYEFVATLKQSALWRHIPILVWTGFLADNDIMQYYQTGANAVMLKDDALRQVQDLCKYWFDLVKLPKAVSDFDLSD